MRVLIVTERFYPEDFRINELALHWRDLGHDVEVLTQVPSYPQGLLPSGWRNVSVLDEQWEGITVQRVKTVLGYTKGLRAKLLNYFSFMLRGSFRIFKLKRPDVIFSFNTGPLTSALPAALGGRLRRIPVVIWTQDLWPDTVWAYGFRKSPPAEFLLNGFVRFVYKRCDMILVSCRGFMDRLASFKRNRVPMVHVPNWAQPVDFEQSAIRLSEDVRIHFTFAGNLGKVQNLDLLLDAWKLLTGQERSVAQLNFVGDGSHRAYLENRVEKEAIEAVVFHGRQNPADMGAWYAGSDVLVVSLADSPLFKLTVPSKFQTCIAAGKPVLAVVGGEVNQLVEASGIGVTADPSSAESLCAAYREFLSMNTEELQAAGDASRRLHQSEYSRDRIFDMIDNSLIEAAAQNDCGV